MRLGVNADSPRCLESDLFEEDVNDYAPIPDATILNGAAVVQMLNSKASRTFQEYGESVFAPYIQRVHAQLHKSN